MVELMQNEARLIGALLEKELTTPEQYPLSLNALTLACNQKSNREPVMYLEEAEVSKIAQELIGKKLINNVIFGSRVTKYKHRFCNTEFSELHLNPKELALVCVMLLRGPQTPGELRTRTTRLREFVDVTEVENVLHKLMARPDGPFIMKLERETGKRDSRYMHLFCGPISDLSSLNGDVRKIVPAAESASVINMTRDNDSNSRIEALESRVEMLQVEVEQLKKQWKELAD
ncbi:MAG: hypothetical protein ACI9Y1_003586 [Lentisphaeria bacterium]|jgi:uncharacterized protein YceH (UPF0502 family)